MILATLCYVRHDGKTLMLHRNKRPNDIHEGKWNRLGGKFETAESPERCVIREVLEESGLEIQSPRLRGLLTFVNFKGNDWYVFVFTAEQFSGELLTDIPEGNLAWIPDDELTSLPLWDSDHIFLPWLAQEKFFSARFVYEGERYVEYEAAFHP